MNRKYDIYICCSRSDIMCVQIFVQNLHIQGFTTWINMDSITSESWQQMMFKTIEDAKVFLFFSSADSNKSSWIEKEVCTAIDMGKSIITIKLDNSDYNPLFANALDSSDVYHSSDNKFVKDFGEIVENKIKEDSSWVFISHSTKDFELVRLIRNVLEEMGRRPILFYLKCLSKKEEVNSLLKREIDARPRFILCDSRNARASEYVQEEVNYIQSKKRMYETIDLSQVDLDSPNIVQEILNLIKPFHRRTSVFLSYSRNDQSIASQLQKQLKRVGFDVWDADFYLDKVPGVVTQQDWETLIKTSISATLDKGYFIALLGDKLGDFSISEIKYAYEVDSSRVLPVTITKNIQPDFLQRFNILDVSNESSDLEKARVIVEALISFDLENQNK